MLVLIHSPLSPSLLVTSFMFRYIFTTYIMPNITFFVHGLLYGSSVHHGFSTPWCLSKHLGFFVKVNTARIAKSKQYSVKQLSVQTESSPVKGKP